MSIYNSLWREFHKLSPEEQKQAYRDFEVRMRAWVDANFYPQYGRVDRNQETDKHDLVLATSSRDIKIEEKFRTSMWGDMNLELLGDVRPPLIDFNTGKFVFHKIGWFYYCDADYVLYSMSDSPIAEQPQQIYMVNMRKLKENFPTFIKEKVYTIPTINLTGIGYSLNLAIDWEVLKMNDIAKQVYYKPVSPTKNNTFS